MFNKSLESRETDKKRKFNKKHLFWLVPIMGVFILMIVQFFWPQDLTRPFSRVGAQSIALKNKNDVLSIIQNSFSNAKIFLDLGGKNKEYALADIGARLDSSNIDKSIFKYDFGERFIPFSLFFGSKIDSIDIEYDEKTLSEFVSKYSKENKVEASDSKISINEKGEIDVVNAAVGIEVDNSSLLKEIKKVKFELSSGAKVKVPYKKSSPTISTENIQKAKSKAENLLSKNIILNKVKYDGYNKEIQKIYRPSRVDVSKWLAFENSGELKINDEGFKKFVENLNKENEIATKPTIINIVDGRERSREEGVKGFRISLEKNKEQIQKYLSGEISNPVFDLIIEEVAPSQEKRYSYTNTQEGLQAKINEIGARYDVRISLKQLNGAGWEANYRENESTPSASTYKLFVAIKLFDEMKKGNRNWDSQILGTSTRDCFYQMIILSTNPCAEEWIRQFGRDEINNFAYGFGISNVTDFNSYDAVRTSASDLRKTVEGIYGERMVSGENQKIMLEHMNKQKWRYGIPTGSKGKVYDKVGFLWSYIHDTAVVEHPRGTYSVAIMTKGASYVTIAQITREIEQFMYP